MSASLCSVGQTVDRLDGAASLKTTPRAPAAGSVFDGFNAGLTFSGVHDSSIGWYNVLTPAVSYTFSPHYSADASLSIYPQRLAVNEATNVTAKTRLISTSGDIGDLLVGAHAFFKVRGVQSTSTASMTMPTGNRTDGLSTGRVTFDFSEHAERYVGRTGFVLDLGAGDSSGLFNGVVTEQYSALGPIAHFQTGVVVWLPGRSYVQSVAYEQLPLGDQKIYTTVTAPGQPPRRVVSGRKVTEDNGFTTSVGIPLTANFTFTTYYNRSLRLHLDTVSTGVTWVLHGRAPRLSMIDRALREAAGVK